LRRTSLSCDSESTMVCFLITSLRCCRKVRGFLVFFGCCCKVKLLFYIDTWHSGEQVFELFWASVSSLEEWGIWSRLTYVFHYEMAEVTLMPLIFITIFHFFSNAGELNPGLCTCWAYILPLSYFLRPKYYYYYYFFLLWLYWAWTQDFMLVKRHSTAWAM
jgi:hypothetical protein